MKERRERRRKDHAIDSPLYKSGAAQCDEARELLKRYLVHTREIFNGKDFLFLGPRDALREALTRIVDFEHTKKRFAHIDFTEVEEYFLLRIVGLETEQQLISSYFE